MLDSPSNKRIFPSGRFMVFAFVFITFFVLISVISIFIIPVSNYSFLQYNQPQVSYLISRLLSNSTATSPQFARKFDGFSRRNFGFSSMAKSSDNEQIPKRTKAVSMEAPSPKGLSFNHDFRFWKRSRPPDESRVSKNPNGYLREVKSPQGSVTNSRNQSNLIGKLEALNFSRNVDHEVNKEKKGKRNKKNWIEKMTHCRFFNGRWVKDQRPPLYKPGSCPFIDESFDCFTNGKPEIAYQKYRWQPDECNLPRWNGKKMLRLLKGKRVAYVGDSLNRNMWESMVCMLRSAVRNNTNVYEASHRKEFRSAGSSSFVFRDYNFSVEFFRSPFLVQEWQTRYANGSTKETLRLDLVERSSDLYRNADILVFNTGHWWTHEKTAAGKGYYQEGDHVYEQLDVMEAFRKAMTTWGRWIDTNVPRKTLVFFRGYSSSHFSGGQWNSGGQCDHETEPIELEKDLPHENNRVIVEAAEAVLTKMKTRLFYLNITGMSEYRRDAHPSIYVKPNMTSKQRETLIKFQDCSHWCLPGVPDTWNEIVYLQLLLKYRLQHRRQHKLGFS